MADPTYEQILYRVEDRILTLTLNRPDKLNAFTATMMHELIDAFDRADADDGVRVVVITGAGRGFCAGADLSAGGSTFDGRAQGGAEGDGDGPPVRRDGGGLVTLRIFRSLKPVIAAVNGPAVGVGATMQLPMDVRLASTEARFGFVFSRRGVVPEACSSWFLPRVVGISKASEWVMTGRVFSAQEAYDARLVSGLYEPDELLPAAYALAREVADNTSAMSVALSRQMLWRMLGEDHPMAAHRIDSRGIAYMGASADAYEGVQSFLEKRPPEFTMKPSTDMPDYFPWFTEPEFS
jgi:enoyl-CoA hydratase/carnithine racemase